jgi:hypothetical protein
MNKRLFHISHFLGFAAAFVGIFLSFNKSDKLTAIETFIKLGIIPLTLMAFIWHTFAGGNIIKDSGFFEKEAGGANLGISVALLVAILRNSSIETLSSILLVYFVYMFIAMLCQYAYIGVRKALMTLPLVIILGYYVYTGLTI